VEEINDDISKLATGLPMMNIQLGRPGAFNLLEMCRGESAAATMTAEEQPPRWNSCRMRKNWSRRGRRCVKDQRRSLGGSEDASLRRVSKTVFLICMFLFEKLYVTDCYFKGKNI
jgi:hypothetical protein